MPARRDNSECLYTRLVDGLRDDPEPPSELIEQVIEQMSSELRIILRLRGLWTLPPRYLGVRDFDRWDDEALRQLVFKAYLRIFCRRLRSLTRYVGNGQTIEAVVRKALEQFVHDEQSRCDKIGRRAFELVQAELGDAIDDGQLHILDGSRKMRSNTLLSYSPESGRHEPMDLARWVRLAASDCVMHAVAGRSAGARLRVRNSIRDCLEAMRRDGVQRFRFGEFLNPFATQLREGWHAITAQQSGELGYESGDGDEVVLTPLTPPDTRFEEQEDFARLEACIEERIRTESVDEPVSLAFYSHCRNWVDEVRYSERKMAGLLGVSRRRIGQLREELARFWLECQTRLEDTRLPRDEG